MTFIKERFIGKACFPIASHKIPFMKVNFKWWQGVICVVRAKFYFRYSYLAFSGARAESLASHIWIFPKGRLFKRTVDDERLAYVLIFM